MSETKKKAGRPKIEIDLDDVFDLAAEGNRCEDIAAELGFSKATLFGRKDVRAAYDRGRARLAINLRHWQMECAKSGNPTMLMWLGKQYLDQQDRKEYEDKESIARLDAILYGMKHAAVQSKTE